MERKRMEEERNRREFLALTSGGTVAFLIMPERGFRRLHGILETHRFEEVFNCDPATLQITPNDKFYILGQKPTLPPVEEYRLEVRGLVRQPKAFAYGEIREMPEVTFRKTLICVGNPVGGDSIGNAEWKGTRFENIMDAVGGVEDPVRYVIFYGMNPQGTNQEPYSTYHPLSAVNRDDVIIAWGMNGVDLPPDHGWPLRLICPGYYGYKNPKWLSRIEFVDSVTSRSGFYEAGGWSREGLIKTMSKITSPYEGALITGECTLCGVAYSPNQGIDRVLISLDDGNTWNDAEITYRGSGIEWVLWKYTWIPARNGSITLTVMAIHNDGSIQTSDAVGGFPSGATGWHRVPVKVELEATPVEENASPDVPEKFELAQNYPNPFNSETIITYAVPIPASISIIVYSLPGEEIKLLVSGSHAAGRYSVRWDGTNERGGKVASGVYILRLSAGSFFLSRKMTFIG